MEPRVGFVSKHFHRDRVLEVRYWNFSKREVGLVILSSGRTRLAASHSLWSYACLALSSRMSLTPFSPIHMTIV